MNRDRKFRCDPASWTKESRWRGRERLRPRQRLQRKGWNDPASVNGDGLRCFGTEGRGFESLLA
jgi:hypothetical protein